MKCRSCQASLTKTFIDLGYTPLANAYLDSPDQPEKRFPLHAFICDRCLLVQIADVVNPVELFSDYPYFSSYSDSWLRHAHRFAVDATDRFSLSPESLVVEIASNDGYLLQAFVAQGIPVLGIEPAENVAVTAQRAGIPTEVLFFDAEVAEDIIRRYRKAELVIGNNVLAHVPDLNDFVAGVKILLSTSGVASFEFPHLLRLIKEVQFDTIYHEHHSYLSMIALEDLFDRHNLRIFDVRQLETHGGSLRVSVCHAQDPRADTQGFARVKTLEKRAALDRLEGYEGFAPKVERCRESLLKFLHETKQEGRKVVAYGAAAKGNTLLNHVGVTTEQIEYVVDRSPHKQGRYLPGSRLPIRDPEEVKASKPDYLLILPWNLRREIISQMDHIREWGGRFVMPIPTTEVVS